MSNNVYKKRAKGSWNVGKGCKGDSEERGYAQREIDEDLKAMDEEYLIPHKKKRKRNKKAQLEYRIDWYTQMVEKYDRDKRNTSHLNYLRDGLKKAKEELQKLLEKESK